MKNQKFLALLVAGGCAVTFFAFLVADVSGMPLFKAYGHVGVVAYIIIVLISVVFVLSDEP